MVLLNKFLFFFIWFRHSKHDLPVTAFSRCLENQSKCIIPFTVCHFDWKAIGDVWNVVLHDLPTLTTQMYFSNNSQNESDGIYSELSSIQRPLVTVEFQPMPEDPRLLLGYFNIFV